MFCAGRDRGAGYGDLRQRHHLVRLRQLDVAVWRFDAAKPPPSSVLWISAFNGVEGCDGALQHNQTEAIARRPDRHHTT